MREVFQQELSDVQNGLVSMADAVVEAITNAHTAFKTSDIQLAEQVIAGDASIDAQADALDELSIDLIARQGPVARDLRILVSSLRISASLERMGDLARHIANLARYRFPDNVVDGNLAEVFDQMGQLDIRIATLLAKLLRTTDTDYGVQLRELDDQVDALHQRVFDTVLADSWQAPTGVTVDATLASRYHERFADHAVSISKKIDYLATGEWTIPHEN